MAKNSKKSFRIFFFKKTTNMNNADTYLHRTTKIVRTKQDQRCLTRLHFISRIYFIYGKSFPVIILLLFFLFFSHNFLIDQTIYFS